MHPESVAWNAFQARVGAIPSWVEKGVIIWSESRGGDSWSVEARLGRKQQLEPNQYYDEFGMLVTKDPVTGEKMVTISAPWTPESIFILFVATVNLESNRVVFEQAADVSQLDPDAFVFRKG